MRDFQKILHHPRHAANPGEGRADGRFPIHPRVSLAGGKPQGAGVTETLSKVAVFETVEEPLQMANPM